jgi:hypothetical protein
MNCSTCKWWTVEGWLKEHGIDVGACQHPMVIQPSYGARGNRIMRRDGVLTCDEGGCTDQLMTGPDFGCIHYATNNR